MSFERKLIAQRLSQEVSLLGPPQQDGLFVPLLYPSPYHVAMSSLGYQAIYRILFQTKGIRPERAFLPDDVTAHRRNRIPLVTYESLRDVGSAPVVFFSVAYELELMGLFSCLELSSIPLCAADRDPSSPLVICGGPLTFSNPLPLGPFADLVVVGEGEEVLPELLSCLATFDYGRTAALREQLLVAASNLHGVWVPSIHGERMKEPGRAADAFLPARSAFLTENTELRSMFLIEPERGCSRGCTYCVMRRSTNGGMRKLPKERVLSAIPEGVKRVGLVGAAVTDHPQLREILEGIVDVRGLEVGISSLRADRLTEEVVGLLSRGGYRTLTVAADGASERLRDEIQRKTKERHLLSAARLAKGAGMRVLKVYMIIGLPGETEADILELVRFTKELSQIVKTAIAAAPFVPKRNTPLDGAPFAGVRVVEDRLALLRKGLGAQAEVRPTSARWAWVEYVLAQGGMAAGLLAKEAYLAGGDFAAWRRAFGQAWNPTAKMAQTTAGRALRVVA